MRQLIKMFRTALILISAVTVAGCSSTPKTEDASEQSRATSTETQSHIIEGTFVAPGVDFAKYRRLIIAELGLADINITVPAERRSETPWALTEQDKSFMRGEYTHAVVSNLIADGAYTTAINPAEDVLLVKSRIVQIAAGKPAPAENPAMAMYRETAGTITLSIELYDSMSHRLIGTITNSRDLGQMNVGDNQMATNTQIRQAFIYWLKTLRTELDTLSGRRSPLDQYLR